MTKRRTHKVQETTVVSWPIPAEASLGSPVRSKGILQEVRTRLPKAAQKSLQLSGGMLELRSDPNSGTDLQRVSETIENAVANIHQRLVLPREIEDILHIKAGERRRWVADGRLQSAGTKTVKLRGRARSITFHIFDPVYVTVLRDDATVDEWRERDAELSAERRRQSAWARARNKADKPTGDTPVKKTSRKRPGQTNLKDWAEFERDGPLK